MGVLRAFANKMEIILGYLEKLINIFLMISLMVMIVSVLLGIATRNIDFPVTWLTELSQFSCIWAIFFGIGLGLKKGLLAGVDLINHYLSERGNKILSLVQNVFMIIFLIVFIASSRTLLLHLLKTGQLSPELRMPIFYGYIGPVIGSFFGLLFVISLFLKTFISLFDNPSGIKGNG